MQRATAIFPAFHASMLTCLWLLIVAPSDSPALSASAHPALVSSFPVLYLENLSLKILVKCNLFQKTLPKLFHVLNDPSSRPHFYCAQRFDGTFQSVLN